MGNNSERGIAILEIAIAMTILGTGLIALAGGLNFSLGNTSQSQQINRGARFLEQVHSSLEIQPFDALLAMNGNQFFDNATAAHSLHRVDLTVTRSSPTLLELELVLRQVATGKQVARVGTLRSAR